MAKILQNIVITIVSDDDAPTYDKVSITYTVCDATDTSLNTVKNKELVLSGQDLTDAQALFDLAKAEAESDEGIS